MTTMRSTPAERHKRLEYFLSLIGAELNNKRRNEQLRGYVTGLLLPGERKSVEPMAAKVEPGNVRQRHQSLHHFVADSPWDDRAVLSVCAEQVLLALQHKVSAWLVDDTGMSKKGEHSVGVARQYCGRIGKQDNCQVAVSLSLSNPDASIPIAYRLYLNEAWAADKGRRMAAKIPAEIEFRKKWEISLTQIREAKESGYPLAPVVADAGYGSTTEFREGLDALGLRYAVGVLKTTTVWTAHNPPPQSPPRNKNKRGRPAERLIRDEAHQPRSVQAVAKALPKKSYKGVSWREGAKGTMHSRFACVRVRAAHRDHLRREPRDEQWLLVEWPKHEAEPIKYWLTTMPADIALKAHVQVCMSRWRIERDYQELKSELGLAHFEGRSWRGFHHHASLCIAAYAFLVCERQLFSPLSTKSRAQLIALPAIPRSFRPRGAASAP